MTHAQLAALFTRERARFRRHFPGLRAGLGVYTEPCGPGRTSCGYRDVAYADLDTRTVWLAARALAWGRSRIVGLIRHELGHLADRHVSKPGAEARADAIAHRVSGQRILYDRDDVQNVRTGSPVRPLHLHR